MAGGNNFLGGGESPASGVLQAVAGVAVIVLILLALFGPVADLINNLLTLLIAFLEEIAPKLAVAMVLIGFIGGALLMFTHKRHAWRLAFCGVLGGVVVGIAAAAAEWLTGGSGLGPSLLGASEHLTATVISSISSGGATTP